ncbi:MAG TPA: GTPase [Rhizomicrobium sp.]|nr:GTPase [Rhizomicrobium sp.]
MGFPNAGKSTLISVISAARPKIANYPFTTLEPNLGVVNADGGTGKEVGRTFVVADLPGLIEGAHEGSGLGDKFLGHAERCGVVLHLVDGTQSEIVRAYKTIRHEIEAYGHGLGDKPEIVALNKIDAIAKPQLTRKLAALSKASGKPVHAISGVSGEGLNDVLRALAAQIAKSRKRGASKHPAEAWMP